MITISLMREEIRKVVDPLLIRLREEIYGSGISYGTGFNPDLIGAHTHDAADVVSGVFSISRIPTGTSSTTVALGNDSRIVGALQASNNLSDVSNAATARSNLGLTIGTNVQAYDAELAALASTTSAADKMPYFTGAGTASTTTVTSFIRTLLDDTDAATARATLGVTAGSFLQVSNNLSDVASVATSRVNLRIDKRTTFSNAAYTVLSTDTYVAQIGTMSASRTVTLPAASTVNAGFMLTICDESGTVTSSNTIVVTRAGSDTVNGATSYTIANAYGQVVLISDGTSKWTYDVEGLTSGGTGATTASGARTNLGLVIGTDVQAYDAELAALASTTSAADKVPYFTGSGTASTTDLTSTARSLLDDTSTSAMRTTLGLTIGSDVQAYDAELAAIAGLTSAADRVPYFTGSGTASLATFTSYARTLVDDTSAAVARVTLGVDKVTTFSNIDYTALSTDKVVSQTGTMSAVRTVTLPAANSVNAGYEIIIRDASGTVTTTNYIAVARSSTDTINGATSHTIRTAYAQVRYISDGSSKWNYDVVGTSRGGTGITNLSSYIQTLLDDADAATARGTLGVVIGTDVQAYDAELAALAGLTSAADKIPYFTGSGTAATTDLTSTARSLLDDTSVSAMRTTLGLVSGGTGDIWVKVAGDTMTGALAITGASAGLSVTNTSGDAALFFSGPAGNARELRFQTYSGGSSSNRAYVRLNSSAESGSEVGSYLDILLANDSGTITQRPLRFSRVAGWMYIGPEIGNSSNLPDAPVHIHRGASLSFNANRHIETDTSSNKNYGVMLSGRKISLQIVADEASSTLPTGQLVFTEVPSSGDNRHWLQGNRGGRLEFWYGTSSASGNIVADIFAGTTGAARMALANDGRLMLGTNGTPANDVSLDIRRTRTLTAGVTDSYIAGIKLTPTADAAFTITRLNYIDMNDVTLTNSAAVTDACVIRFNAAAGTHKAVAGSSTKTTPGSVQAWLKVNINGTIHYAPLYTSMTA